MRNRQVLDHSIEAVVTEGIEGIRIIVHGNSVVLSEDAMLNLVDW